MSQSEKNSEYPTAEQLGDKFLEILKTWLKPWEMREVAKRNREETSEGVCHSHDFCDANMAMDEAWTSFGLASIDGGHGLREEAHPGVVRDKESPDDLSKTARQAERKPVPFTNARLRMSPEDKGFSRIFAFRTPFQNQPQRQAPTPLRRLLHTVTQFPA